MKNFQTTVLIPFILLFFTPVVHAQAPDLDYLQRSGNYYFGVGTGSSYIAARNSALSLLSESISVHIQSYFEHLVRDFNGNVEKYSEGVVNTYSATQLRDYKQYVLEEGPDFAKVLVYIEKTAVEALFREREKMIHDFIDLAAKAETDMRIDDMLRYYYWGLVLTRSHPQYNSLRYHFGGDRPLPVMLTLNDKLRGAFSSLRFEVASIMEQDEPPLKQIELSIKYKDKPVQGLDYTYHTGDARSGLHAARNGMGIASLDGGAAKSMETLRLYVEYRYENKAALEPEVQRMIENVEIPNLANARFIIRLSEKMLVQPQQQRPPMTMLHDRLHDRKNHLQKIRLLIEAIHQNRHDAIQDFFTAEGWQIYRKLITGANVRVLKNQQDSLRSMQVNDEVMVRSVPMLFAYNTSRETFVENVVFTFNSEGLINSMAYALSDIAINDILGKPENFGTDEEKYFLIKFMEDFKTAYALKRLDYLNAIFDENALIIVGNIVERMDEPIEKVQGMYASLPREEVEFIRMTKSEYMNRLNRVFRRNEFINIRFENNEVRKTQKDDKIYGIQIAQHYYSSTYADKGYLFLMIDLNDSLNPRIYVRTWQPRKNEDGTIYGLEDFRF